MSARTVRVRLSARLNVGLVLTISVPEDAWVDGELVKDVEIVGVENEVTSVSDVNEALDVNDCALLVSATAKELSEQDRR